MSDEGQLVFEGFEISGMRANLGASQIPVDRRLPIGAKVRVTVEAEVVEVRMGGDQALRVHVLRPVDARLEEI